MVKYTEESLVKAVDAVMDKSLSVRAAAKMFSIPKSTLFDKLASNKEVKIGKKGPPTILTADEETALVLWINTCMEKGFPRQDENLLDEVQAILRKDGRDNPFVDCGPGRTWLELFLNRHPETHRKPEALSKQMDVTEEGIKKFKFLVQMNCKSRSNLYQLLVELLNPWP